LILRKIVKIVATRCHILQLKCTKFSFGWSSAPDPRARFKGPTSRAKEGKGWQGRGRGEEGGKKRGIGGSVGERREDRGVPVRNGGYAHVYCVCVNVIDILFGNAYRKN